MQKTRHVVAHICDPGAWDLEGRRSEVQGQCWLQSKLETILGSMRSCLQNSNRKGVNEGGEA